MQKIGFEEAVVRIRREGGRYDSDAYIFLRDALDQSVRVKQEKMGEEYPHVAGRELLLAFRDLALDEFGPMAETVLEVWGLTCSEDVGEMVFQLIGMGAFGQSDDDSRDDFKGVFSFDEAFREPFRPRGRSQESVVRIQEEEGRGGRSKSKGRSETEAAEGKQGS